MCGFDPFTIMTVASTAMSAFGAITQGNQAATAGQAQQSAYYQQADNERMASNYEASRVADRNRRAQSAALTQVAGSGVMLAGSPTEVLEDNARQSQMDIEVIMMGSTIKQNNLRTQGDLTMMQGEQRQTAGYIGAATNVASGLSELYRPRNGVVFGQSQFARTS